MPRPEYVVVAETFKSTLSYIISERNINFSIFRALKKSQTAFFGKIFNHWKMALIPKYLSFDDYTVSCNILAFFSEGFARYIFGLIHHLLWW